MPDTQKDLVLFAHPSLELGTDALRGLGCHPYRAEKLKLAFDEREQQGREALYRNWVEKVTASGAGRLHQRVTPTGSPRPTAEGQTAGA